MVISQDCCYWRRIKKAAKFVIKEQNKFNNAAFDKIIL